MPGPPPHTADADGAGPAVGVHRVHRAHLPPRPWPVAAITVAGVVTLVGVFSPWVRSGSSRRSSFEIIGLVERLGFAEASLYAWTVRLWPIVPLLVVSATVAAWAGRHRVAAGLGGVAALYVGGVAAGLRRAPDAALIGPMWGADLSVAGALGLLAGSIWLGWPELRRRGQPRQSPRSSIT